MALVRDRRTGLPSLSVWAKINAIVHKEVHKCFVTCSVSSVLTCGKISQYIIIISVRNTYVRVQRIICCINVCVPLKIDFAFQDARPSCLHVALRQMRSSGQTWWGSGVCCLMMKCLALKRITKCKLTVTIL